MSQEMEESRMKPNFETVEDFQQYVRGILLVALVESGAEETAKDFEEALFWIDKLKEERREAVCQAVIDTENFYKTSQRPNFPQHGS
jgi:hypothetical protein